MTPGGGWARLGIPETVSREVVTVQEDAAPFFIGPHRFDADDPARPVLDRRYALIPEPGERVLGQHRLGVTGQLLGPTESVRAWELSAPAAVTVTDRRLAYVCPDAELSVVPARDGRAYPRHRRPVRLSRLVSGQIRWQWPSRLELADGSDGGGELRVVCDALRTIRQPSLALAGPDPLIVALARQIRRAVAAFRLVHPELVELSPPERDTLLVRVGGAPGPARGAVTLPGSLPVEFLSRDDYYRPARDAVPAWPRLASPARNRPGSAC
ncbi:hypothetical protein GA0070621_3632 [Micromonospora narathiwatensis]|uniref:Uncharacterized protein n=1 Tax=Micromonospora narathiwatensis TaxID=299146 RepID=A0A1A9A1S7_9ACTN|nr:hypothetical protein GA0070621_3632 [Micromonospora narathiwatensis]